MTTDCWTSTQNIGFMCLTADYIDKEWKLKKKFINFSILHAPHTGEVIGQTLEECLSSQGIEKLSCVTVNYASDNDGAIRLRLERFSNKKNGFLVSGW